MAGEKLIREAIEAARAAMARGALPPAENSRLTQIATTGPSYDKALRHLERAGIEGRAIDYGAGRGHGLRSIGADTFEPYPQGWTPTFTKPEDIPDDVYRRLVNLNVLNVLDPEARQSAVLNMGRVVEPGGGGVISTRGRDVMAARGEPGPEPMSLIIGEGDNARYQKGFTPRELREYVGDTLGPRFDVEPSDVGAASIMFRRNREDGGPVEERDGFQGGGVIRRAIEAARKVVAPEDLLMGIHNTAEGRKLDMIERLGGLPAPSIAITKPSQGYTSFGDISLVAPVEMVTPGRKTPVFGSDVYSPRFPSVEDDQIFRGFTPAGNRRYAPLTMENVLREMKGNVRGGESFNYGPASIRAQVTPQFGSLPEMQAAREKIIPSSEFGAQKDMSTEMMERLRERFEPYFKPTDPYRRSWSAFPEVLTDYARTGRPSEFAYDYKDLPAEALTDARSFLSHLRDMPTEYFEAKPQRAVPLSEFSGAVVPADVPGSVVDRIRNMGINRIEEYGDDASRAEALMKFVGEQGFAEGGEVRGGRLLEDQYPTHYLPNVGRQVMADGGVPTEQSRRRATLEQLGSFEDRPVMDPATMGENWANAVRRFRENPVRPGEAAVRPLELGGRDVLGGAIAGDGGIVRSRIADIVAGSRGLPGSGTLGFGLADFTPAGVPLAVSDFSDALRNEDYLSAGLTAGLPAAYFARKPIMAAGRAVYDAGARAVDTARDVLGRVPAPVAAGGAGAAVMAPEEAEASKLRAVQQALERVRGSDLVARDPRAATVNLSKRTPSGDVDFGQGINSAEYTFTRKGDLQPWKEFDPYQAYKDRGLIAGLLGDRSAAGSMVHEINGVRLTEPVNRTGGGEFQRSTEGPEVWASRPSAVKNIYTRINKGMEELGASSDTPVFASHVVMGHPGIDSTQMMAKGILRQIEPTRGNIDLNKAEAFDASVREKFPDWPGILNPEEAEAYLAKKEVGKRTSTILQMLDTKGAQVGGLPNLGTARFAMMEPRLVSADQGATGFAISRLDPNRITNAAASDTYPTGMLGPSRSSKDYVGGTRYQIPLSVMFPDWWKNIKPTYLEKKTGLTKATTPTNIQQSVLTQVPLQRASQEWLDNLMAYMEENPKKWGYRRGGGVSHHAMMLAREINSSPREETVP